MLASRPRRLRRNKLIRDLVSQTQVSARDLVMPYFVIEGHDKREPVRTMPGVCKLSIDNLAKEAKILSSLGVKAALLFGSCRRRNEKGSIAYSDTGIIQKAVRYIKSALKDIVVITDVCLCGYTSHGHCGILKNQKSKIKNQKCIIDNDETLKALSKIALSHARAGVDFVAPSAMMDGQVGSIRESLDSSGFEDVGILAYSAKYASSFYGPFRDVLDSFPRFGDRKSYQMDWRNQYEALKEIKQDIAEGADIVMVKPALAYLDVIKRARDSFNVPIAAYNVSGEYSMVKLAAREGMVDEKEMTLEILNSMKRAGADIIITYSAKEAAEWLKS